MTPKGYRGTGHETIGSDILAVLRSLALPEQILGAEVTREISEIDPKGWYPIAKLLDFLRLVEQSLGETGMRKVGRTLFKISHEARVRGVLRSARDIVYGLDGMYHHANRGKNIGGWQVLVFEPGHAAIEKTTPHPCVLEVGIFDAAFQLVGTPVRITQSSCIRTGADSCVLELTSPVTDTRWTG